MNFTRSIMTEVWCAVMKAEIRLNGSVVKSIHCSGISQSIIGRELENRIIIMI